MTPAAVPEPAMAVSTVVVVRVPSLMLVPEVVVVPLPVAVVREGSAAEVVPLVVVTLAAVGVIVGPPVVAVLVMPSVLETLERVRVLRVEGGPAVVLFVPVARLDLLRSATVEVGLVLLDAARTLARSVLRCAAHGGGRGRRGRGN